MTLSLSEIVNTACTTTKKEDKVKFLKQHNSVELRNILILMYDKSSFELSLPSAVPPYTPSEISESHGMLYREARKLKYFIKDHPEAKGLTQLRKEQLFIQMLETVDKEDAELLVKMIQRKPLKGLTAAIINEAFGPIIKTGKKEKE